MHIPSMTRALACRIQDVLFSLQASGTIAAQQYAGNPYDIHLQRFGPATAYAARAIPGGGWWNRVVGFEAENIAQLDEILAFFRVSHLRFYLDMDPISLREDRARQLIEHGFCPAPNGPFLYGLPSINSHESAIDVRETQDIDLFLELWAESFEFPRDPFTDMLKDLKRGPFSLPENHLYIAYVEGTPAAIGALYLKDSIGHLNAGGTLPGFRKRGCHTALTTHRIAAAARFHCELVTGDTGSLGSISQIHMQRAGLQIAFTRLTWVYSPC